MCSVRNKANARYLRQSVQLTGLGTSTFNDCISNILNIYAMLSREVPPNTLEAYKTEQYRNYSCLNIYNRYFTSRRDDPTGMSVDFGDDVDPRGILASLLTNGLFHGEDNKVLYFERDQTTKKWATSPLLQPHKQVGRHDITINVARYTFVYCAVSTHLSHLHLHPSTKYPLINAHDHYRFQPTSPSHFRVGDIVEVQITISMFPIGSKVEKYKMFTHLRSIALLDNSFAQVNAIYIVCVGH